MAVAIVYLIANNAILTFKNGYYEGVLMNNRDKFSPQRFSQIERIIRLKSLVALKEMINFNE